MRQTEEEHSGSTGAYALPKFNYFTYNMIFFPLDRMNCIDFLQFIRF